MDKDKPYECPKHTIEMEGHCWHAVINWTAGEYATRRCCHCGKYEYPQTFTLTTSGMPMHGPYAPETKLQLG